MPCLFQKCLLMFNFLADNPIHINMYTADGFQLAWVGKATQNGGHYQI